MRKVSKLTLLAAGVTFFVAACDQAPTNPSNDGPDVSAAVLDDDAASADGAANFESLELCKVWEDDTGAPATPFATTFTIQADDPDAGTLVQNVTIDGTESPTPGCKVVLLFDGTTDERQPAEDISIVEAAPPANWAVTDISTALVLRGGSDGSEIGVQEDVANRTWSADLLNNDHGVLVTFTNTFTPPGGGEGCTPGYWKNHAGTFSQSVGGQKKPSSWEGFLPTDSYDTVFGVTSSFDGTLIEALIRGGGGENALGRHAVAALLNAAHSGVDYDLSTAEVIQIVQDAYGPGGDFEDAKNTLAALNEQGCPL